MTEATDRKKCTQDWLEKTTDVPWTRHDVAYARKLLKEWMVTAKELNHQHQQKLYRQVAIWSNRIVERWLHERKRGNVNHQDDNLLLEEGLHRVLHVWRRLGHEEETRDKVLRLLNLFLEASVALNEPNLLPRDKAYSMVFAVLALQPHLPGTCQLAEMLMKQCCQQHVGETAPDLVTWNSYLHVLSKCSPFEHDAPERAESVLFQDMSMRMVIPDAHSFGRVLHAWAKSGRSEATERVKQLLEHAVQKKIVNTVLFNITIDALGQSGNGERAEALLREMIELHNNDPMLNVQPDVFSFFGAMKGWSKSGAQDAPERCTMLMNLMQQFYEGGRTDLKPSIIFYNLLLETWAQTPDSGSKVEHMLWELQEQYDQSGSKLERPNLQTYATAIRAWANTSSDEAPDRAHTIVKHLENLSKEQDHEYLTPDPILYTSLIHAWSMTHRQDAPKQALTVLHHMQSLARDGRANVAPSTVTYNAVMNVLCKHEKFDSARKLLDSMKDQVARYSESPRPDFITYATIIHACARSSDAKSGYLAKQLIEEMEVQADMGDASLQPSSSIYASVIYAYRNIPGEGAELAEDLLLKIDRRSQLGTANVLPNTGVCNAALRVWSESRAAVAPSRAEKLLSWMLEQAKNLEHSSVLPDEQSFNIVMNTWARSRRRISLQRIKSLMENMEKVGFRPDVKSWNSLLESLLRSNLTTRVSSAYEIFREMMTLSRDFPECTPNTTSYNLMIGICCPQSDDASARRASLETLYDVVVEACASGHELMTPQTCLQTFRLLAEFLEIGGSIDNGIIHRILQQYTRSSDIDKRILDSLSRILDETEVARILAKHSD